MVDSEPLWYRVERAFVASRGGNWTRELALRCVGRGMPHTLVVMSEAFRFPIDQARDTAEIVDGFIARTSELALKPGCQELLDEASGKLPLAVASSSPRRLVMAVLQRFGIADRFRTVVTGDDVARTKPAPDIFLRAASELGVPPAACAVFEDSLAGSTAGRAAGMFVVSVPEGPWEGRGFDAVADLLVRDLFEGRAGISLPG